MYYFVSPVFKLRDGWGGAPPYLLWLAPSLLPFKLNLIKTVMPSTNANSFEGVGCQNDR